jgi:hypothetical protein
MEKIGKVADHLDSFHLNSWTELAAWGKASSLFRNQSWDYSPQLFSLKTPRDLARAFLV